MTIRELRKEIAGIRRALGPTTWASADPRGENLASVAKELQRLCLVVDGLAKKIEEGART